jgi:DNA-binding cell septation regulator SpoVG
MMGWIPQWMIGLFLNMPSRRLQRLHDYMDVALGVAREVVHRQTALYTSGKEGSKDIMSILGIFYP